MQGLLRIFVMNHGMQILDLLRTLVMAENLTVIYEFSFSPTCVLYFGIILRVL